MNFINNIDIDFLQNVTNKLVPACHEFQVVPML